MKLGRKNKNMYEVLTQLEIHLNEDKQKLISEFVDIFKDYNSKVNLVSKNDINFLFEKHIYDSLAFNLFYRNYNPNASIKLMDMGTGGGFPALPIALCFDNFDITAVDSINKKINFIKYAAEKLKLQNIMPVCSRVENLPENFKGGYDIVVSRAMAELKHIMTCAFPYIKNNGYFVAYKSVKADEEICAASQIFKKFNLKLIDKIEYSLPLTEKNTRVLLVIKKDT